MKKKILNLTIKLFYFTVGLTLLIVGILGLILPILPGIVLILLSLVFFAKISERFRNHNLYLNILSKTETYTLMIKNYLINYLKKNRKVITLDLITALLVLLALMFNGINNVDAATIDSGYTQVKTATSPAVYYLNQSLGLKKAYTNEVAYLSYGNKWSDVKVVDSNALSGYQNAYLIKTGNSSAVYYIKNGQKAVINSAQEFLANGFKWSDILTVTQTDLNSYGDSDLATLFNLADSTSTVVESGGSINNNSNALTISLGDFSTSNPYLVLGSYNAPIATFKITSNSLTPIQVNSLRISLKGVHNTEAITKAHIIVDNVEGNEYDANVADNVAEFSFGSNPLFIMAKQTREIKVTVDTKYYPNWQNQIVKAVIEKSSDIGANAVISGSFPLTGKIFQFTYAPDYLGMVKVEEQSLNNTPEAIVGTIDKEIAKFKISETSKNEDVIIKEFTVQDYGSASFGNLVNFTLKQKDGKKISQIQAASQGELRFVINDYKIEKGKSDTFTISADIKNGDGQTINLDATDIKIKGVTSESGLGSEITNIDDNIAIVRKSLSVIADDLTSNDKVFSKQSGVIAGVFEIRNNDQEITLQSANLSILRSANTVDLNKTFYLVDYNTGELLSYANPIADTLYFKLLDVSLKSKQTIKVALLTDIPDETKQGDKYNLSFNSVSYRVATGNYFTDAMNVSGADLTISKTNLYIFTNSDFYSTDYTKGQTKVKLASFYLEASYGETIKINSLSFAKGDTSGLVTYENGFSNVKAYIGSTQVGSTITRPYSDSYTFDGFAYRLSSGKKVEVSIYADTVSDLKVSETQLMLTNIQAVGNSSGIITNISGVNTKSNAVYFGGLQATATAVSGGQTNAGQKSNNVASFTVTNSGTEKIKLTYITITTTGNGLSNSLGYTNLKVKEHVGGKTLGSLTRPVAGANRLSLNGHALEVGSTITLDIYVDAGDFVPQEGFNLYLSGVEGKGYSSNIIIAFSGIPTASVQVNGGINTASNTNSDGSADNGDADTVNMIWPVSGSVTYGFGATSANGYPYGVHTGIDISVKQGTVVKAALAGTVIEVYNGGMDNASYIIIKHDNNLQTVYGHLSRMDVSVGDDVVQGQAIGLSGGTPGTVGAGPNTTGPHLHFEVRVNNAPVDPTNYLN